MSKYKLIALDMDGTLLNSKKEISPKNMEYIEKAFEQGKHVVISTGRCVAELQQYIDMIPNLRYLICMSGAMIYDLKEEKIIYSTEIPAAALEKIKSIEARKDVMIILQSRACILNRRSLERLEEYNMGEYRKLLETVSTKTDNVFDYVEKNKQVVGKVNICHTSIEEMEETKKELAGFGLEFNYANGKSLEISPENITKGTGIVRLCEYLGIDIEETIAVGDADNDMDGLKKAGLGVAMENALERVKDVADDITKDCDNDGCAWVIEKYLLD